MSSAWGLVRRSSNHVPRALVVAAVAVLLVLAGRTRAALDGVPGLEYVEGGIVRGDRASKRLALVFTGHEFAEGGTVILDALAATRTRASFFLTGDFARNAGFAPLIARMVRDGHYVGPHSDRHLLYAAWDNRARTLLSHEAFTRDLDDNLAELARFGVRRADVRYWVPPYEWWNAEVADWSRELGVQIAGFTPGTRANADYTGESDPRFVASATILESIQRQLDRPDGLNGFILLMHLGAGPGRQDKWHTHVPELIRTLQSRGYALVRLDELLHASTPRLP
jgi:peptidoglycan/xylan/chitin deacetylase (PgdA/CDA1 family)